MLNRKIDFAIIIRVNNANPNGDPLNGNRPRTNYDGYGEMSDVCLKRKIRNRLLDDGEAILVQSDDYCIDGYHSIKERYDNNKEISDAKDDYEKQRQIACKTWYDVRAFGQVLAFKKNKKNKKSDKNTDTDNDETDSDSVSIGIRGPVSIQNAFSKEVVDVESLQITKSVNLETNKNNPLMKNSDTMGMKHRVNSGIYVSSGSINRQLAEKTGFSDEDAEKLKKALCKMFDNDESSARPAGSMEVIKVIWWTHEGVTLSSAKVHRSLVVAPDGTYSLEKLEGIATQELDGQ